MNIKVKNLSYSYSSKTSAVLNDLNINIQSGTVTVLLGLNGCGKTTLIKCLSGILNVKEGDIFYGEKNLKDISIKERSKIFSYVAQNNSSSDDVMVEDYLLYGMTNKLAFYMSPSSKHIKEAEEFANTLGISKLLKKKLGELSGGERQLVSICTALLQDTEVILLDEPLSALDLKNQQMVLSTLKDISRNKGKTLILSDHNPNHALYLESNVVLLKDGNILEYGKSMDLINVETMKKVYGEGICNSSSLDYQEISIK